MGAEERMPSRLSKSAEVQWDELNASWSRDGNWIAFVRAGRDARERPRDLTGIESSAVGDGVRPHEVDPTG